MAKKKKIVSQVSKVNIFRKLYSSRKIIYCIFLRYMSQKQMNRKVHKMQGCIFLIKLVYYFLLLQTGVQKGKIYSRKKTANVTLSIT